MTVNNSKVMLGTPMQSTTGAIQVGAITAAAPTSATDTLTGFTGAGYVSEDGVTITPDYKTDSIKDWSASTVRDILSEFTGEISWTYIQTDYDSLCQVFGDEYVVKTEANATHGAQNKVSLGAHLPAEKSWCVQVKDGDARVLVYVPKGQAIPNGDITLSATDPLGWPIKVACHPDSTGNSIYIFTDDGVVSA